MERLLDGALKRMERLLDGALKGWRDLYNWLRRYSQIFESIATRMQQYRITDMDMT
jgi:hypothetical protein